MCFYGTYIATNTAAAGNVCIYQVFCLAIGASEDRSWWVVHIFRFIYVAAFVVIMCTRKSGQLRLETFCSVNRTLKTGKILMRWQSEKAASLLATFCTTYTEFASSYCDEVAQ